MKEEAFDCPLNMTGNMFKNEIDTYKDCKENECPSVCDYTTCHYKCSNKNLNEQLYDPKNYMYKKLDENQKDL